MHVVVVLPVRVGDNEDDGVTLLDGVDDLVADVDDVNCRMRERVSVRCERKCNSMSRAYGSFPQL